MRDLLANKKTVFLSMTTTIIMAYIVMAVVDPMIDGKEGLGVIALQLAFDKAKGMSIVLSWDIAAFKTWIFADYLYAFSYAIFFASLVMWLEKIKGAQQSMVPYVALFAGIFDWVENSIELWFLNDMEHFSSALFFLHSVFATLKWLALPVVLWRIVVLLRMRGVCGDKV